MSDGMRREFTYLSSHATNRYFIPNWGIIFITLYTRKKDSLEWKAVLFSCYIIRSYHQLTVNILGFA